MTSNLSDETWTTLTELRSLFPNWRVGQLLANVALAANRDGDFWNVEDEELLAVAKRITERNPERQSEAVGSFAGYQNDVDAT